ncbi:hypothetical protein KBZ21_42300, partial [Streptomyces sp. A73]|nr:hypothetical protein [Streptomyces sp. A73]
ADVLARLEARVAELEALLAAEKARGDLLRDQRDGARDAVELEQASHQHTRLHGSNQPRAIRATTNHELPKEGK